MIGYEKINKIFKILAIYKKYDIIIVLSGETHSFNLSLGGIMEERIKNKIGNSLDELNLCIDNIKYEKEGNNNYLRICLDSSDTIDVKKIVEATKIINPLIDELDLINEEYILDVYGKSKGE